MTDFPLTTTLNRIYECKPCQDKWKKGLTAAGKATPDDEPITYAQILDAVGIEDAIWCCRAEPQHAKLWRLYAVWCARRVQHLMTDPRSIAALDIAERYANGQATDAELAAAKAASWTASLAASWAAYWSANRAASWAAYWDAAKAAAWAAALAASKAAERQAQSDAFRQLVTTGTLP